MDETVRQIVEHLRERDDAKVLVRCDSPEVAATWFDAIVRAVGDDAVKLSHGFRAAVLRSGSRVQVAVDRDGSLCRGCSLTLAVDLAPTRRSRLALLPALPAVEALLTP